MTMIYQALALLAVTSVVLSHPRPGTRIPQGCRWARKQCPDGLFRFATCNCDCPGTLLCCDEDVAEIYRGAKWSGIAPSCEGRCVNCGAKNLCWYQSKCGDGKQCFSGNKVLK